MYLCSFNFIKNHKGLKLDRTFDLRLVALSSNLTAGFPEVTFKAIWNVFKKKNI